jgi:hypothetical protein
LGNHPAVSRSPAARRLGVFHLVFNVATVVVALPLIERFTALAVAMGPGVGPARTLANAHILFNSLGVLVALPFVPALGRLLQPRCHAVPLVGAPVAVTATHPGVSLVPRLQDEHDG